MLTKIYNNLSTALKTFCYAKERSSAGSNASAIKLLRQSLPYYFNKKGFAYKPLSLFIIINGCCNMACRMCDIGQNISSSMFYKNMAGGDFEFDNFCKLIEEVKSFQPFISITSTEPLLYPMIDDAVAFVKGIGMEMNITTNGFLLEKHAEKFVRYGLDKITVSIDGPPDIHDSIRKTPGAFNKIIKGINLIHTLKEKYNSDKPLILINSTICDLNVKHLEALLESLPMEKIKRIGLMPMIFLTDNLAKKHNSVFGKNYPATSTCLNAGINTSEIDTDFIFLSVNRILSKYGNKLHLYFKNDKNYLYKFFKEPEIFLGSRRCLFPWFAAQINAKGQLLGLTRCFASTYGNVFDNGFDAAWNGYKIKKFRMDLQKYGAFPACSRCEGTLIN